MQQVACQTAQVRWKRLKDDDDHGADDLLLEPLIMVQVVGHPNVVSLIGVVPSSTPLMLMLPVCDRGWLHKCLED